MKEFEIGVAAEEFFGRIAKPDVAFRSKMDEHDTSQQEASEESQDARGRREQLKSAFLGAIQRNLMECLKMGRRLVEVANNHLRRSEAWLGRRVAGDMAKISKDQFKDFDVGLEVFESRLAVSDDRPKVSQAG
ncbi:hypothetical protein NDU88_001757 [Pleurodeles waltl]|uniref:Uncharacterized protein n=1 Tax=Pleurodeles waltl TaxID=8319 RepID=A0AAV7LZG9_PLEWA|nr:hypothetical protein NDU88_001757 [Pleurodeles waltl]